MILGGETLLMKNDEDNDDGLVAYYSFNGNANDSINSLNGTVANAVLTTDRDDNEDSAYDFNGTNARITISPTSYFDFSTLKTFTITAWIKHDNTAANQSIFCIWGDGLSNNRYLAFQNSRLVTYNGTTNSIATFTNTRTTSWEFYKLTFDEGVVKLYVDGDLKTNVTINSDLAFNSSLSPRIGSLEGSSQWFDGKLDEIKIYNIVK